MNISEICKMLELHFDRAEKAFQEIQYIKLDNNAFLDFEHIKTIDTFIYRFLKIQDYMGVKLFPAVLYALGEFKSNMSLKDMLNKLERLELMPSADKWMGYREIRNILTHEYPDNEDEIIEGITLALTAYEEIRNIYQTIRYALK
jgi:hypothetical protein